MLLLVACGEDSGDNPGPPPASGCLGLGVKVERIPSGVELVSLAGEIGDAVPDVACRPNKIAGVIRCTRTEHACGLPSRQEAEPMRMQIAAFLTERDQAAAEDAYAVSIDCACYSD